MRRALGAIVVAALVLAGCSGGTQSSLGDEQQAQQPPREVARPRTPPAQTAANTRTSDDKKMQDIRVAILEYFKENRAYPRSLADLSPKYLPSVPKTDSGQDFAYDPSRGLVIHPSQIQPPPGYRRPVEEDEEEEEDF